MTLSTDPRARLVEQQKQHFEAISDQYYEGRQSPTHQLFGDLLWSHFLRGKEWLRRPGLRVLEPMCGFGHGRDVLLRHLGVPIEYQGFDYSEPLIDRARELNPDVDFFVQDVTRFEPQSQADLIVLLGGLHHVPDHAGTVVEKLAPALPKGGAFISFEPTNNTMFQRWIREGIYRRNDLFDDETERAFTVPELNGFFRDNGFEIRDQLHCGLLAYVLFCNPDCFPALNVGGKKIVRSAFAMDRLFMRTPIGRLASFATLTLYEKA
ncbi:MAG: class I SAM-dependent methyltransferase [Planctomycetota bacterium]